jgi:maleylacetate reductase
VSRMHAKQQALSRSFKLPGGVYNATPGRIFFGAGTIERVADAVRDLNGRHALVVSTPGRRSMARDVAERLGPHCCGILAKAISQVPVELAVEARARARELGADCLVSIGGGASIGLGKAIALELRLPIIAIPTTYSGSEMTGFCGITIEGVKRMHTSLQMLASTVIYDPDLSVALPVDVSAASALNALAHCVDCVYVPTVSPIMVEAAYEGAAVIAKALPRVASAPGDVQARSDLLYGGFLGGAALTGGFALQHGLAHVLGGSFGVSHGLSHALVLPHVAAYNARFAPTEMACIAEALGARDVGEAIFELLAEVGLPTSLAAIGFDRSSLDPAARLTVETDHGQNPGPVTFEAVRAILDDAFEGRRPSGRAS